jgi:Cu+-exporting ATPase
MIKESIKKTIKVSGMTCSNCAKGIEKHLSKNGFQNVYVDFANAEVSLSIDSNKTISNAKKLINSIGFKAYTENTENKSTSIEKLFYICLAFTLPLFLHMFASDNHFINNPVLQFFLCLPVFVISLSVFGKSGWNSIKSGIPNMDVLIIIGVIASFFYSVAGVIMFWGTDQIHSYLFFETSATITTLVLLGNLLEKRSVIKTTSAIKELSSYSKVTTQRINPNGDIEKIESSKLRIDDIIIINNGDKIPTDGIIINGNGYIDESLLSGESNPVYKKENNKTAGGTLVLEGSFKMKVTATSEENILSQIIKLVKQAQNQKPKIQKTGDKISSIFVPIVLVISLLTFTLSYFAFDLVLRDAIMRSIAVLVISCPCAMGLATPTAVMVGLGRAAKNGILIKGGDTLEQFAKTQEIVFDKTGTITNGEFIINKIDLLGDDSEKKLLKNIIYSLETHSSHPLANAIKKQLNNDSSYLELSDVIEEKGLGIKASYQGNHYSFGSAKYTNNSDGDFNLFLTKNKKTVAKILCTDQVKKDAKQTIKELENLNISSIILSGDSNKKCEKIASEVEIKKWFGEQSPSQKLLKIEELNSNINIAMIGDGINDAPALSKASIGISIGGSSQIAIDAAQIVLLDSSSLKQLKNAYLISKHTLITIKQNLFWAFSYNIVAIPLAAFGHLEPMYAALFMAFSDVIVIGNSLRLKRKKLN